MTASPVTNTKPIWLEDTRQARIASKTIDIRTTGKRGRDLAEELSKPDKLILGLTSGKVGEDGKFKLRTLRSYGADDQKFALTARFVPFNDTLQRSLNVQGVPEKRTMEVSKLNLNVGERGELVLPDPDSDGYLLAHPSFAVQLEAI